MYKNPQKLPGWAKLCFSAIVGVMMLGAVDRANAAAILDTTGFPGSMGSMTLGNFITDQDPLGQTFTLSGNASNLMIGGYLEDVNSSLNPTLDFIISLVSGAGTGGSVLGSVSFTLADGFNGLHMEDFSSIGTIGPGTYTVLFSSGGTGRGALRTTAENQGDPNSDPYNEDGLFTIFGDPVRDFSVRVTGDLADTSPIPEPTSLALFTVGLTGVAMLRRRRRKAPVI